MQPVTLRTDRLLLRPFEFTDADDVYAYARDPEWGRYLPVPSPYERRHAVAFVAHSARTSWVTNPVFAISLDDRVVGAINMGVHEANATAEMGYGIARQRWGMGLAAEAARAVIGWAFGTFDLAKITASADVANTQSWRVMEKLGMTREGVLRSQQPINAEPEARQDRVVYSVLRGEWEGSAAD